MREAKHEASCHDSCAPAMHVCAISHDAMQELQDWRQRLNEQVQSYQVEIGSTRSKVTMEIESLRSEFMDLRNSLRQQMDRTWAALGKTVPGQGSGHPGMGAPAVTV